jgi:transcriptional regulator with XRE-family HTH domain
VFTNHYHWRIVPCTITGGVHAMTKRKPSDPRNDAPVTLGSALRKRREEAGLSITEMASRLQVSPSHLSRLERDEIAHPSANLLQRITKCCGIRPEDLYALTGLLLPTDLPELVPYLRAKHPDWPDFAIAELDAFYHFLKYRHSLQ